MMFSRFTHSLINPLTLPKSNYRHLPSYFALIIVQISCCVGLVGGWTKKVVAAENIILNYGALEFPVSVKSLETYATTGKISGDLKSYVRFLNPEQLQQFQVSLTTSVKFDHLAIAQFLYSYQGEKILQRVSSVIQTKARQPGFYAIRSALILAAADTANGGLTPLNVVKKFPTKTLRIDSRQGLRIIKDLSRVAQINNQAIAAVEAQAVKERQNQTANVFANNNWDLGIPGRYAYSRQELVMKDSSRDRTFNVDLYLPKARKNTTLPLLVISHGLGGDATTFIYLAKHLASYGFAVAVPVHPGSSSSQIQALLSGLAKEVTPPAELIDRPLDIKFLLDQLAKDYGKQIDTNNVGMIGQSFGAYTTLALAGAKLNWSTLKRDCLNYDDSWNLSLLIQCLALQLPPSSANVDLQDRRIKAALVINPLVSSVFGQENIGKIGIPTMIVSGSSDSVTPARAEQIIPFTWLTTSRKYLVLLQGGTHFSTLGESSGSIPVPTQAIGPNPKIAQRYIKQLSLAFFSNYITQQSQYANYLNSAYGSVISNEQMPLSLITSLDQAALDTSTKLATDN
ncbi:putative dienelactone hydrolase [Chondrocystis sp. NIES-4102]|nr:putative dienelactone hydrolase [Chondrocystis sp. NIES-4102]